jgi:CheY-like chemotaxis protein
MLEKLGFSKDSIKYVENGKQAVEAYKIDTSYKLVLMDIQMPIMNGLGNL